MAKSSDFYPRVFQDVAQHVRKRSTLRVECETSARAASMKTSWYSWIRALKADNKIEIYNGSVGIKARTEGNVCIFEDRDEISMALALKAAMIEQNPSYQQEQIEEEIALGLRNRDGSLKQPA